MTTPSTSERLTHQRERLLELIAGLGRCVVAYSGGVDSAVVAMAAHLALGEQAIAVTAHSASLASGELEQARDLAARIGIRHEVVATTEFDQPAYTRNASDRCYHCKTELYTQLEVLQSRYDNAVMLNGANLDDQGDYRPGMQAAAEHRVRSPLLECEMNKDDVRKLAEYWQLPVWDKPASPCLSSRVAYGEEVNPTRLAMIDAAERFLRDQGLRELRVRYHKGDLARLEVPADCLERFCASPLREAVIDKLRQLGFRYVTLDLEGFRSGSLNQMLPLVEIKLG